MNEEKERRERLKSISKLLTQIHKELMDHEMEVYAYKNPGPLPPSQKLNLLLNDPAFQWLRQLSQLISHIDGFVFQKEPLEQGQFEVVLADIRKSFLAETSGEFQDKYKAISTARPDIIYLHQQLKEYLALH